MWYHQRYCEELWQAIAGQEILCKLVYKYFMYFNSAMLWIGFMTNQLQLVSYL